MTEFSLKHEIVPARTGGPPHPAMLLLHGRGADERDLLPLAEELDPRLFVIAPRAPFPFEYGGYMWYDLDSQGVGYPEADTFSRSVTALRVLIDELSAAYPIDLGRLYIGGFSMGAAMSATLALTDPQRFAGAVILSGYLPLHAGLTLRAEDAAGLPIFQAHGLFDQVIPLIGAQLTRDVLAKTAVDLTYRQYPIGHEISSDELQDLAGWFTTVLDAPARGERRS